MTSVSTYQLLIDTITQAEHDQSLFESELGNELQGVQHSELVSLGNKMIKRFRIFVDMGKVFADQQQPNVLAKMLEALQDYEYLLMPPKVFGGYCPCLKPARSGPEYDKRYLIVRCKVVAGTFLAHSILIESKGEKINMDSMHFADYSNKMNSIFNNLQSIQTKGNDAARETAKNEILAALELVNRFMKSFEEETAEFKAEVRRRIASTSELLTSRPAGESGGISRRILVKAQSSLQEIMNSAAGVSLSKSKEAVDDLERLNKELKNARTSQVAEFQSLEDRMQANNILDMLYRLREDMEIVNSDAGSKIRDALKRWNLVKSQSTQRPVAEYSEESESSLPGLSGLPLSLPGPSGKGLAEVGQSFRNVGSDIKGVAHDIKSDFKNFGNAITGVGKMATGAVTSSAAKTKKKATELLGLDSSAPQSTGGKYTAQANGSGGQQQGGGSRPSMSKSSSIF